VELLTGHYLALFLLMPDMLIVQQHPKLLGFFIKEMALQQYSYIGQKIQLRLMLRLKNLKKINKDKYMIMIVTDALKSLRPKAEWSAIGDNITWLDTTQTEPTQAEIDVEITRLQAEYDAQAYTRDRAIAYPSLQDQADMQYWDSVNGTTTWVDAIAAVKAEFPKP